MDINGYNIILSRNGRTSYYEDSYGESSRTAVQNLVEKIFDSLQTEPAYDLAGVRKIDILKDGSHLSLNFKAGGKDFKHEIENTELIEHFDAISKDLDELGLVKPQKPGIFDIADLIRYLFHYFMHIRPAAEGEIKNWVSLFGGLEACYIDADKKLFQNLCEDVEGWESFYTVDEFHQLMDKMLVDEINRRIKAEGKEKTWDSEKLNRLNNRRVLSRIKNGRFAEEEMGSVNYLSLPIDDILDCRNTDLWQYLLNKSYNDIYFKAGKEDPNYITSVSAAKFYLSLRCRMNEEMNQEFYDIQMDKVVDYYLHECADDVNRFTEMDGIVENPLNFIVDSAIEEFIPKNIANEGFFSLLKDPETFITQILLKLDPQGRNTELQDIVVRVFWREIELYAIKHLGVDQKQLALLKEGNPFYSETAIYKLKKHLQTHPSGLTKKEQIGLFLLKKLQDTKQLSEIEKLKVADFIVYAANNRELYKKLESFFPGHQRTDVSFIEKAATNILHIKLEKFKAKTPPLGIGYSIIKDLRYFIAKTKSCTNSPQVTLKAENLLNQSASEKLSFQEIGQLIEQRNLTHTRIFHLITENDIFSDHKVLKKIVNNAVDAKLIVNDIEDRVLNEVSKQYKDGSILMTSGKKRCEILSEPFDFSHAIAESLVDLRERHAALLYHNHSSHLSVSHMLDKYHNAPLQLYELLTYDVYEMDVSELVHPAISSWLEQEDTEWKTNINKLYQAVMKNLHSHLKNDRKISKIKNPKSKMLNAGISDYHRIAHLLGKKDVPGHKTSTAIDPVKIHKQFYQNKEYNEEQICSEFAAKATIAALMEVNDCLLTSIEKDPKFKNLKGIKILTTIMTPTVDEINYLYGRVPPSNEVKETIRTKMLEAGYTENKISAAFAVIDKKVIDIPFDPYENLETILPSRMTQIMLKRGCIKKTPPPKFLTDLVHIS